MRDVTASPSVDGYVKCRIYKRIERLRPPSDRISVPAIAESTKELRVLVIAVIAEA